METIVAIGLKLDQDDRHTHIWKKKTTLCAVTVLVDSQVSDRCPWATCLQNCDGVTALDLRQNLVSAQYLENG